MKSTEELIIIIGCTFVLLLALGFILIFNFLQAKKHERIRTEQEARLAYQEKLLHKTLLTQKEEREHIAQDIHKELGSKLDVMYLYLHQLKRNTPEAKERIDEMVNILSTSIKNSRRICHDLLPPNLEKQGHNAAAVELCEAFRKTHQVEIELEAQGEESLSEDAGLKIHAFRISRDE